MVFSEAMEYINSFTHSGSPVKDLSRIRSLMHRLGDPQDRLRFVHIAGTNGKGSVLEYCSNALISAGYKTAQFTSPYIENYCDRIRINGEFIPEERVAQLCGQVKNAVDNNEFSQFEITFAIAMLYFLEEKCDIIFLETGIGGDLDATNIIKEPLVSVITSVSLDHTAILGGTVEEIASHKLGIVKEECPAVISFGNKQTVLDMAQEKTLEMHSKLTIPDKNAFSLIKSGLRGSEFSYKGETYHVSMCGAHQAENAVTAMEVLEILKGCFDVSDSDIKKALMDTHVPSRAEIRGADPVIIIDGGHNTDGIDRFAEFLTSQGINGAVGVFGMVKGKAVDHAVEVMSGFYSTVYCADSYISNALTGDELAEKFRAHNVNAEFGNYKSMTHKALEQAHKKKRPLIVSGSLYLTSAVRKELT